MGGGRGVVCVEGGCGVCGGSMWSVRRMGVECVEGGGGVWFVESQYPRIT